MDGQTGTRDSTFEDQITAQKIAFCKVGMYSNTLNSAHFGTGNFPHYSKSALFEVTVM